MLKAKSEGLRTDPETRELEALLHDLRMRVLDLRSATPGFTAPDGPR